MNRLPEARRENRRRDGSIDRRLGCAALTIYDMCKAVQKDMVIGPVLLAKSGEVRRDFKVGECAMIKVLFLPRCASWSVPIR